MANSDVPGADVAEADVAGTGVNESDMNQSDVLHRLASTFEARKQASASSS